MSEASEDITTILESSKHDFSASISIDITKIQSLFENLCFQVLTLQKEMKALQGQLNSKVNKDDIKDIEQKININTNDVDKMGCEIEDLKGELVNGLQKNLIDAGCAARSALAQLNPDELKSIINGTYEAAPSVVSRDIPTESTKPQLPLPGIGSQSPQISSPQSGSGSASALPQSTTIQHLASKVGSNESKISDLADIVDRLQNKVAKHDKEIKKLTPDQTKRNQRYQDLLADLNEDTPLRGNVELEEEVKPPQIETKTVTIEPRQTLVSPGRKSPIVSPGRKSANASTHNSAQASATTSAQASARSIKKSAPQSPKPETPKSENKESVSAPPPAPAQRIDAEDLLGTFIDAARMEIDNAKKEIMDEVNGKLNNTSVHLSGSISKVQASSDVGLKKANAKINELDLKHGNEIKNMQGDFVNRIQNTNQEILQLQQRVQVLENRFDTYTKAADENSLKTAIKDDGTVDMKQVIGQLQASLALCNDLNTRLIGIEKRIINPDSFDQAVEKLAELAEKAIKLEQASVQGEMKVAELREIQEEMKNQLAQGINEERFQEMQVLLNNMDEDNKKVRDAMVKCNKDLIGARAAINTLRSHSEETRSFVDENRRMCENMKDDVMNTDMRVKKVIGFVQNETNDLAGQIKECNNAISRNADRIEEIQKQSTSRPQQTRRSHKNSDDSDDEYSSSRSTNRSKNMKTTSTDPIDETLTIEAAEKMKDESKENDLTPSVVQLPEKVVYEQPVVTVVRKKQIEVVENMAMAGRGKLPRLASSTANKKDVDLVRNDVKRHEGLFPRVEQCESSIRSLQQAIEQINKTINILSDKKADKEELQSLFEQFRLAMGELNNRIGSLRKTVTQKAEFSDLQTLQKNLYKGLVANGETAAGTETIRCLTCGRPRSNVAGAIDDPLIMRELGQAMSTRVIGDGDGTPCFVYGEHGEMFFGRSSDGNPVYSTRSKSSQSPPPPGTPTPNLASLIPPSTAPMASRKVIDNPNI